MTETRRPDFFIVGAPKSGTTTLHAYLRQHPQVFLPAVKELHFFGTDLQFRRTTRLTEEEYLAFFTDAGVALRAGEASVRYLYSSTAAAEIKAFAPDARILVMLRNPADMMHAMHGELLFSGVEDIEDFADALAAEPDRRAGRRIPAATNVAEDLFYRDLASYEPQLRRYFDTFGRDRVHVTIFDDFLDNPKRELRALLRFLDVEELVELPVPRANPSKRARSRLLRRIVAEPPPLVRGAARRLIPRTGRKRLYRRLQELNALPSPRTPLAPELRARLVGEIVPGVIALERLLARPLPAWTAGAGE